MEVNGLEFAWDLEDFVKFNKRHKVRGFIFLSKGNKRASYWSCRSLFFQIEITIEIGSKGLIRAIGEVLLIKIG